MYARPAWALVIGVEVSSGCRVSTVIGTAVEAALEAGQDAIDVHAFPFRMTEDALAREAGNLWLPYWQNLKQGFDLFEATTVPPQVAACKGEYRFGAEAGGPGCVAIAAWS